MTYTIPVVLTLLATAVLAAGLRHAPRSRRPGAFRRGVIATTIGVVCLWALPVAVLATVDRQEYEMLLLIGALLVAASLLGGGVEAMRRAGESRRAAARDPFWDNLP